MIKAGCPKSGAGFSSRINRRVGAPSHSFSFSPSELLSR